MSSADAHSRPSGTIVSPLMGQFTPAQVMTSPRALTMSLPCVRKGPYGHSDELLVLGNTTSFRSLLADQMGSAGARGTVRYCAVAAPSRSPSTAAWLMMDRVNILTVVSSQMVGKKVLTQGQATMRILYFVNAPLDGLVTALVRPRSALRLGSLLGRIPPSHHEIGAELTGRNEKELSCPNGPCWRCIFGKGRPKKWISERGEA